MSKILKDLPIIAPAEDLNRREESLASWRDTLNLLCGFQKNAWEKTHEVEPPEPFPPWSLEVLETALQNPEYLSLQRASNKFGLTLKDVVGFRPKGLRPGGYFLKRIHFSGQNLSGWSFLRCDMEEANLSLVNAIGANFGSSNLKGTQCHGGDFRQSIFFGANVDKATFTSAKLPLESFFCTQNYQTACLEDVSFYLHDGRRVVGILLDEQNHPYEDPNYPVRDSFNLLTSFENKAKEEGVVRFSEIVTHQSLREAYGLPEPVRADVIQLGAYRSEIA